MMKPVLPHRWDLTPKEAIALQNSLRARVRFTADFGTPTTVAGVDVGVKNDVARAAVVVLDFPSLQPRDQGVAELKIPFPYIPGLLAFREMPAVLAAVDRLTVEPDVFIVDGHGFAHPRRFGIACHLGVVLDRPSIGCAKSRLVGSHPEPDNRFGAWAELRHEDQVIGAVVRSRVGISPLYVSIGHRVDLPTAIDLILKCCRGYRLPETSRLAHRVAGGARLMIQPQASQPGLFDPPLPGRERGRG
jgi:deoxyribonuclease V